MSKVRIKIKDVINSGVSYAYMLLLQTFDEKTVFPIFISNKDADSFVEVLKNIHFKRPQTHALLMDFFERFDIKIKEVYIHKLQEGIFYSTIYCSQDEVPYEFDARPSDSLILALKSSAPGLGMRPLLFPQPRMPCKEIFGKKAERAAVVL